MNFKKIVQFNKLREQLSVEELAVADAFRESSESDRALIAEALQPQKSAGKKATKTERKVEHCAACDYTKRHKIHKDAVLVGYHEFQSTSSAPKKSQRASGMAAQLNKNLSQQRPTDNHKCVYEADGKICLGLERDAIHDATMGYGGYHEFVAPAQSATASGD